MMRLILFFILLITSVWFGIQLSKDPGYLIIAYQQWTVETTLLTALIAMIILLFVASLVSKFIIKLFKLPRNWRLWRLRRKAQKARLITRKGLIEYSEGYWKNAKNHLIKALPNADAPLLNYLTAARAAQKMGDSKLRDQFLREAQRSMPEAKMAIELTQAELQIANEQWEQALATLRHLQHLAPDHPYVLKLLIKLYQEVKDWRHLIKLLPDIQRHHVVTNEEFEDIRLKAYLQAIHDLIKYEHKKALSELIDELPKKLIYEPEINIEYCQYLLSEGDHEKAERILRRCLRREFNKKLAILYSQCEFNTEQQLHFTESLLKKKPHSSELYLCLGRLASKAQLWGKAKNYLENSLNLRPMAETYLESGKLYEQLNEPLKATDAYKKGLQLKTDY